MVMPWERDWSAQQPAAPKPWERDWGQQTAAPPELDIEVEQPGQEAMPGEPADEFSYGRAMGANPMTSAAGTLLDLFGPNATVRGAAEGAADIGVLANPMGARLLTKAMNPAFDAVFGDDTEYTARESLGRNVMRMGTGAAIPSVGLAAAAERAAPAATSLIGRAFQKFTKPYAENPGRAVQGDIAAGVGAGTATSAYETYAPESVQESGWDPVARIVAAIGGGVGGSTVNAAARGTANAAKNAGRGALGLDREVTLPVNPATGEFHKAADVDAAALLAQQQASNPAAAAANIDANMAATPAPIETLPTAGLLSDDVGLVGLENKFRQTSPRDFIEQDQVVNTQARSMLDDTAPDGSSGRDATDYLEGVQRNRVGEAQMRERQAYEAQDALGEAHRRAAEPLRTMQGPDVGPRAAQGIDRTIVDETLVPLQERMSANYGRVDPNRSAILDAEPLVEQAQAVRSSLGELNDPAKVLPRGLLNRIESTGVDPQTGEAVPAMTSVGDIVDVMPELSQTITRARKAGNYRLADNLAGLRASMKGLVSDAAEQGDEAAQRFMQADEEYARDFAPIFKGGPGDEAQGFVKDFNLDRQGRSTTPPSQTAERFLRPGQPEKAQSLARIIESSPNPQAAQRNVRDYMISDLANIGAIDERTGALRPQAIRKWQQKWGETLNQFPAVRQEVDAMLDTAMRGSDADNTMANLVRQAERGVSDAEKNTGALRFALGNDPETMIKQALGSGDPERNIQSLVNLTKDNPRARAGLKAAVRDYFQDFATQSAPHKTKTGKRPVSFHQLDTTFQKYEKALAEIYTPEEMQALRGVHQMLRPMKNREMGATTGSQTAERQAQDPWKLVEIGLKGYYGILKGGGILRTLKIWASTLPNNETAVQQVVHQMWFDPELAKHLLTRKVDVGGPGWNRKLNTLLGAKAGGRGVGAPAAAAQSAEDEDDPTKTALQK